MNVLALPTNAAQSHASLITMPPSSTVEEVGSRGRLDGIDKRIIMARRYLSGADAPLPIFEIELSSVLGLTSQRPNVSSLSLISSEVTTEAARTTELEIEYDIPLFAVPRKRYLVKGKVKRIRKGEPVIVIPEWLE